MFSQVALRLACFGVLCQNVTDDDFGKIAHTQSATRTCLVLRDTGLVLVSANQSTKGVYMTPLHCFAGKDGEIGELQQGETFLVMLGEQSYQADVKRLPERKPW